MSLFPIFLWSLLGILAVLVVGFLTTMFSACPEWLFYLLGIQGSDPSGKYKTLRFLGIGMGGVLVALQALMSYRRAKAMEDAAQAQAEAVSKTEQGQRQERLKNAIEHLGNEKGSVRLGGAYELFHLAQDTPELGQTVLDILCAHIRQTTGGDEYREKHKEKPSEEVQSMLTLLFVQEHEVFKKCEVNLQGSWLDGAYLAGRLARADLNGAYLRRADLWGAQLQGADLRGARLQGANLEDAQLQRALLKEVQLQGAKLLWAQLQGAWLEAAQLQGANLEAAQLQGACLKRSQLQGTDLWAAQLEGADLCATQWQGAKLLWAQLRGATSDMSWAKFEERIRDRIGKESELSGVIFAGGLRQHDIDSLVKGLPDKEAQRLREELRPHLGKPRSHEPPAEAVTGAYTAEAAERWIAEYKQATSEVPKVEADRHLRLSRVALRLRA